MTSRTYDEYLKKSNEYFSHHRTIKPTIDRRGMEDIERGFRDFLRTHRRFSALRRTHGKGRHISDREQRALIKAAPAAEINFKNAVRASLQLIKKNKSLFELSRGFVVDNYDDVARFSNPIFFDKRVRSRLREMGFSMMELRFYHNAIFNSVNAKVFKRVYMKRSFQSDIEQLSKSLDRIPFPESLETMRKQGMITITGSEEAVPYIVGAALIVVAAVIFYYCPLSVAIWPQLISVLIDISANVLMTEAAQDLGAFGMTQDGYWSISIGIPYAEGLDFPILTFPISPSESEQLVYFPWEVPPTPGTPPTGYTGVYIGNYNPIAMEVHRIHCAWLHLIRPDHIRFHDSLRQAHSAGLDNCYYCIGGSTR